MSHAGGNDGRACIRGCTKITTEQDGTRTKTPRRAREGWLCDGCSVRLLDKLDDIPEVVRLLPEVVEPGSVTLDETLPAGKRSEPPAPVRLDVLAASDDRTQPNGDNGIVSVRGVLAGWSGWVQVVRYDRSFEQIERHEVDAACLFLRANIGWLSEQTAVEQFYDDIDALHRWLISLIGEQGAQPIGSCPKCGHLLWMPPVGVNEVRCRGCDYPWPKAKWLELSTRLKG